MSSLERNENGVRRRVQPRGRRHYADVAAWRVWDSCL